MLSRYLPLLLSLWACAAGAQQADAPRRIASLNLCTDLLLMELVPRERIVSLTYWAADPDLSYLADEVGDIPLNHSLAEEIIPLRPDLVLAGQFSDVQVISLLRRLGTRVEVMEVPLTLAGMREHLLELGELVGAGERARQMADSIDRGLTGIAARSSGVAGRPLAVVYGPQGVSPGQDTLMDDLLALTGYRNLAAEAGIRSYGTLSLETLVMADPDLLIIDDLFASPDSMAHQALRHPALRDEFTGERLLAMPSSLTACLGPPIVTAAELLLDARSELLGPPVELVSQ